MDAQRQRLAADMARRAGDLAARLGDDVVLEFDEHVRRDWTYLPGARAGVPVSRMDRTAARMAMGLLAAGLSVEGYARAVTVMALEDLLDVLESGRMDRHRGDYWLAIFGDPGALPGIGDLGGGGGVATTCRSIGPSATTERLARCRCSSARTRP